MLIKVGDRIPQIELSTMTSDGPMKITPEDLFAGKKVTLFGVPGAFTPTCSAKHLPGFVKLSSKIKDMGVDTIGCLSVNDPFVMGAWGIDQNVKDKILMLADGSAKFVKAAGLQLDLTERGMGMRCKRFLMNVVDSKVTLIEIDESGKFEKTSAEFLLARGSDCFNKL